MARSISAKSPGLQTEIAPVAPSRCWLPRPLCKHPPNGAAHHRVVFGPLRPIECRIVRPAISFLHQKACILDQIGAVRQFFGQLGADQVFLSWQGCGQAHGRLPRPRRPDRSASARERAPFARPAVASAIGIRLCGDAAGIERLKRNPDHDGCPMPKGQDWGDIQSPCHRQSAKGG